MSKYRTIVERLEDESARASLGRGPQTPEEWEALRDLFLEASASIRGLYEALEGIRWVGPDGEFMPEAAERADVELSKHRPANVPIRGLS